MSARMIDILKAAEKVVGGFLMEPPRWRSLEITYEKPHVQRLWCDFGDYRIMLHRIWQCEPEEALMHPHPWPSAVRILSGGYLMRLNRASGRAPVSDSIELILSAGSCYAMEHVDDWHSVSPINVVYSDSLMVTGRPNGRRPVVEAPPQPPLHPAVVEDLRVSFLTKYFTEHIS